jgi:hypothetical protein
MSSVPASTSSLVVSGDVGLLADENAQRLVSIFMEAGMSCLQNLRDVVEKELVSKGKDPSFFQRLYAPGLASISQWSIDMLQGEVVDIEARYPETTSLHQFVYLSLLSEAAYSQKIPNVVVPSLPETYHAFLKRLVTAWDVQRGQCFFQMPQSQRRVVFLEAFRNAYHDMARRCVGELSRLSTGLAPRVLLPSTVASAAQSRSQNSTVASSVASDEDRKPRTKSLLQKAMLRASERPPTSDARSQPGFLNEEPSARPLADAGKDEKDVVLFNSHATLLDPSASTEKIEEPERQDAEERPTSKSLQEEL